MIRVHKPAILDALPPERGVIQASAGTGKTYILERMVIDLILRGVKLEQILVVTFTEKATLELKARIRAMLERFVALPEGFHDSEEPGWTIDAEGVQALCEALQNFERATISTIHGFCRRVLQESAFEGGSLLKQELADGRALLGRAWREVIRRDASAGGLQIFMRDALSYGMTFETIEDLLWKAHSERGTLLPVQVGDPNEVMANYPKGWENRWQDLDAAIEGLTVHFKTKQAFRQRLVELFELMAKSPSAYRLRMDWDFHYLEDKEILAKGGAGQELFEWLDAFQQATGTPEAMIVSKLLPLVRLRLREIKDAEGLYDHDDTILQVCLALDGTLGKELVTRFQDRYKVALIDEFQDTDQAQWNIFKTLFGASGHSLYVIGDPKQAIYGFRGGDLPTYRDAVKELLGTAQPQELQENHRSTQSVISAYNLIFTGGGYDPKTGKPVTAFFTDRTLYPAESAVKCGNTRLVAETGDGDSLVPVQVLRINTLKGGRTLWRSVARVLAREIKDLIQVRRVRFGDPDAEEPEKQVHELHYGDVQILVEKRKQGREMAEALRAEGIPCSFFKQDGLLESTEAMDLLDCLAAVLEPRNRTALARALVTPFFGYSWQELEALKHLPEDHKVILRLLEWQALASKRLFPQMFESMLHRSGLVQRLRIISSSERSLTNFLHLTELLIRHARNAAADLEDLVRLMKRWLAGTEEPPGENGSVQRLEGERRAVQILTMHQSKGLEAPIVALYGFTKPNMRSSVKRFHRGTQRCLYLGSPSEEIKESVEEERSAEAERLYYVALTRAQARLLLPCFMVDSNTKKGPKPSHPGGNYKILNRRLREILEKNERSDLFQVLDVPNKVLQACEREETVNLSAWILPQIISSDQLNYQSIRRAAKPPFTTSYSSLHDFIKSRKGQDQDEEMVLDGEQESSVVTLGPDELPRGAKTGIFLHQLLEEVDLKSAEGVPFDVWWADAQRRTWVTKALDGFGIKSSHAKRAGRMVFDAITVPLGSAPLTSHDHVLRELGFLARYLDTEDLFQGAMDVIFERDGKIHLLDWKSDALSAYDARALDARVRSDYLIQIKIYLNIVLAYFNIEDETAYERRFGDLHYVFLRGLPDEGVWSWHPAWSDVLAWRQDLRNLHEQVTNV